VNIDHSSRSARFGVGELATFAPGPREPHDGQGGRWRMELGSHWHRELRAAADPADAALRHEVPVQGVLARRGWLFHLEGRLDQLRASASGPLIREFKTTLARLPLETAELRATHPSHFIQLGLYVLLLEFAAPQPAPAGELLFIEAGTGLQQAVAFTETDRTAALAHLDLVAGFLEDRRLALERLRTLSWQPAFATPRPGQETILTDLTNALNSTPGEVRPAPIVLAAPTGYGKTGVLLETAFAALRAGRADRVLYLTGKSTGQLHVLATLQKMLADPRATGDAPALSAWNLRPKREHCVNDIFHCTRERCRFLHDLPRRHREAGLARFHLFPADARGLPALRAAGLAAQVCPYEIARAALPSCSVWLGDFNYLFAPANRGVFVDQPTWNPATSLLIIDEAHHLPSRIADAHSHALTADEVHALLAELPDDTARSARRALEQLWSLLAALPATDSLDLDAEDDLLATLRTTLAALEKHPVNPAALSPSAADWLFRLPALLAFAGDSTLEKLLWCPRPTELRLTCLDAAPLIGEQLRAFAGVILATATPPPPEVFAAALGLGSEPSGSLVIGHSPLALLTPPAPWRDHAYDVALDLRVDTTFRQRDRHLPATAATLATLRAASTGPVAAFFPSYAYAEKVLARLDADEPGLRCVLQPRAADLAAQQAWIEEQLALADVLAFVLGGSFAEGIDHLGGRVSHALVVGPALPEVNALQHAREAALARHLPAPEAFRRAYLVPGLQKVNQALGRLVRAPGQSAKVLLHCRRFADPAYASLLAPEYQLGRHLLDATDLATWLAAPATEPRAR